MGRGTTVISLGKEYDARRAERLSKQMKDIDGVTSADFDYISNKLTTVFDPDRVSLKRIQDVVEQERKRHTSSGKGYGRRSQSLKSRDVRNE